MKGRASLTGYEREKFGGDWASVNRCDMRDRILARDLKQVVRAAGSRCQITSGRLVDPDTAKPVRYVLGGASEVDIDHVVALGDAWQKGARQWGYAKRVRFANDPLNLLAVAASANRQKGDADAASWLPPNKAFRCGYVARQVAVKRRYGLWVTRAERAAMQRVLSGCPDQSLPEARRPRISVAPGPRPAPTAAPPKRLRRVQPRSFENCTAARAAGVAPIIRGSRLYAYNSGLDRDGDGIACE